MGYLANMLPYQLEQAVKEQWPVIIPSGCIEFHGNHLPLGTDIVIVEEIIKRVEPHIKAIVCPTLAFGPTGYVVSGPEKGTIDVRVAVFKEHVKDILLGLYDMGFRNVIVVQHHQGPDGPGGTAFKMAANEIYSEKLKIRYGNGWYTNNYGTAHLPMLLKLNVVGASVKGRPGLNGHGGLAETEPMMVLRPETVEMDRLKLGDFPWNWNPGSEASQANIEHGKELIELIVSDWIEYIQENYQQ